MGAVGGGWERRIYSTCMRNEDALHIKQEDESDVWKITLVLLFC